MSVLANGYRRRERWLTEHHAGLHHDHHAFVALVKCVLVILAVCAVYLYEPQVREAIRYMLSFLPK